MTDAKEESLKQAALALLAQESTKPQAEELFEKIRNLTNLYDNGIRLVVLSMSLANILEHADPDSRKYFSDAIIAIFQNIKNQQ